jgi:Ser/Thr protein kinase RdoA (MazF antagonist)
VIDFDDAMYHWYIMDLVQALQSLKREVSSDEFHHKQTVFVEGYRSNFSLDSGLLPAMPLFRRFASLYRYTRIRRSIQERWDNEPSWLVALRAKLTGLLAQEAQSFGRAIESSAENETPLEELI